MNLPPATLFLSNQRPAARVDSTRPDSKSNILGFGSLSSLAQVSTTLSSVAVRTPSISSFVSLGDRPVYRDVPPSIATSQALRTPLGFRGAPLASKSPILCDLSKDFSASPAKCSLPLDSPSLPGQFSPVLNLYTSSLTAHKAQYLRPLCVVRSIFQTLANLDQEFSRFDPHPSLLVTPKRKLTLQDSQASHPKRVCSSLVAKAGVKPEEDLFPESFVCSVTVAVDSFFSRFTSCAGSYCEPNAMQVETRLASLLHHDASSASCQISLDQRIEYLFNSNHLRLESKLPSNAHFVAKFQRVQVAAEPATEPHACDYFSDMEDDQTDSSQFPNALTSTQKRKLREVVLFRLLDELDFLQDAHNGTEQKTPQDKFLCRLVVVLLFVIVCRCNWAFEVLDRAENRKYRNWILTVLFQAIVKPKGHTSLDCSQTILLSKMALARLDCNHKKIPREVVEVVLRPALMQFCDLNRLDGQLVSSLHSIVQLCPFLFKEVFGKKVLDTLEFFATNSRAQFTPCTHCLVTRLLDFFRLFASTGAFSCEAWLDRISVLVVKLEQRFPHPSSTVSASCEGFRSPLCRLLCLYPTHSVDLILRASGDSDLLRVEMFKSILRCKHAGPLVLEFNRRSLRLMSNHSSLLKVPRWHVPDVQLVVGENRVVFQAHRIVLASASPCFELLLQSPTSHVGLELVHVQPPPFELVLRFVYSELTCLSDCSFEVVCSAFSLADQFALPDLKTLCEDYLCQHINRDRIAVLLDLALRCSLPLSKKDCQSLLSCCGSKGGERLLRACQSYMLCNLGNLLEMIDVDDDLSMQLLASELEDQERSEMHEDKG
eukprot:c20867_g1_i1.p1 GENE.c20867_g1_i1~~c20867_g1_i1.p1  ORF type:complete len:827 (+),score=144.96 c20867_g1_i1:130-2610(+)